MILSGLTPKTYQIRIFNFKFFYLRNDFPKDALVGITCVTSAAPEAYALADRYKKAGCKVIMGGPHASCMPEEALQHCDSVCIGEAESVWPEVIKDFESNSLRQTYQGEPLDDFIAPVYNFYMNLDPLVLYRSGINLSRGCKYQCDFCARPPGKLRFVKIEQAVALIKHMKKAVRNPLIRRPWFGFIRDNNWFSDPAYAKELFRALEPLHIKWGANSSLDIAFDDEALRLAKAAGCELLFFGFETSHPGEYEKTSVFSIVSLEDYLKVLRKMRSYGIKVIGAFVLGLDEYTHLDYLRLLFFMLRARMYYISLTIATPFPGTQLYHRLKEEGRIRTFDWGKYDLMFHVVFKPKHMSAFALLSWFRVIRIITLIFSTYGAVTILSYCLGYGLVHYLKHYNTFF